MKWQGRQGSSNIEDRRGQGSSGGSGGGGLGSNPFGQGGGGFRLPSGRSGGGLGGLAIIIVFIIIALAFGINPMSILTGDTSGPTTSSVLPPQNASEDELAQFVSVMVKDTEDYWGEYFSAQGQTYAPPKVVLFSGQTSSGCGTADTASGPFYCPNDRKVYIDLGFYDQLRQQFGAPGDFAQAYVIAHEVGHHVQNLIGVLPEFNRKRQTMTQDQANAYSVRVELQADCFAGVWGKGEFEKGFLESGDVAEAINAANQIGDDTLTNNTISPRQYTHGTSEQRMKWFQQGYTTGDPDKCDTINGPI
ncbi:MAG: zinc metallopeptidase [Devosia nanyangense]|uniref:Zinc metallopeptidase n=1 Tax=Devosia nanyangense TaxID=1228055 RepID=A0A933NX78_9HYPH|nr:zinc metallopeptidase [Devosia nanyangense]